MQAQRPVLTIWGQKVHRQQEELPHIKARASSAAHHFRKFKEWLAMFL
jgi:hypothetical protein